MLKEHRVEVLKAWLLVITPTQFSSVWEKSLNLSELLSSEMGIHSFTHLHTCMHASIHPSIQYVLSVQFLGSGNSKVNKIWLPH